ncbi:MAG: metallophosphoesterase family protein [Bacilli bacterium]|nr:metallophosphoesterase family protein [Bacilli bacterium]
MHKNILRHQKNRLTAMNLSNEDDIEAHDKYIIDMWHSMVNRGDQVYVLGDFIMANKEESLRVLNELKKKGAKIHLIVGNHDRSTQKLDNMFESIELIKVVQFKKNVFEFLEDDFEVVMCHYPMKSWHNKCRGSMHLYGHVHANSLWMDEETDDMCLNVGLDNPMCGYKLFSLEQIYDYYLKKLNGIKPQDYSDIMTEKNDRYIR